MSFVNYGLVTPRLVVQPAGGPAQVTLGGLQFTADQKLLVANGGTIARWLNGLPLDETGRLVVSLANGAVTNYSNGLAYNAFGRLEMTDTFPIVRYVGSWPVDHEGRVCCDSTGGIPPLSFNLPLADLGNGLVDLAPVVGTVGTFVRGTTAFTTLVDGSVKSIAIGVARSRYEAGVYQGYFNESSKTNRCLQSQAFGTTWVPTNITVASDTIVAPDGTLTADTLTATAANATLMQAFVVGSLARTFSIWLRRKTGTGNIAVTSDNGASWTTVPVTASWARYQLTQTIANPTVGIRIAISGDAIHPWGAQFEDTAFATSYIPTTSTTASRNTDILNYPSAGNLGDATGSAYVEATQTGTVAGNAYIVGINGLGGSIPHYFHSGPGLETAFCSNGVGAASAPNTAPSAGPNKIASSWGGTSLKCAMNGGVPGTDAFGGSMGATTLKIGNNTSNSSPLYGCVKNFKIWSGELTDAQMQAITAP